MVLLFRFVEEIIPLAWKHGGLVEATQVLLREISWPLFSIMTLWVMGGLLLYCLASELMRALDSAKVREIFFGTVGG